MDSILYATGITVALTVILSVILLIAERWLVRYGPCKLDINRGERDVEIEGGQSLLASLRTGGIYLPSACGGRGTCAYCKCKITAGGGPVGPTEEPLLTPDEVAGDVRIACQVKVRNDIELEIPESLLAIREFSATVEKVTQLTHDIRELRFALTEPAEIKFTSGQYMQLESQPYDKQKSSVFRAYSISSKPSDTGAIELIIRLVPGGICTTWVFEHLKEGDPVKLTGPFGEFRIAETNAPMVWIAGGSGMAPFWSMVRHLKEVGNDRPVRYFFGAVNQRDLFFLDELRALEKELDWFTFIPVLSGSGEGVEGWDGRRGLVTEAVADIVEENSDAEGYLCGSPGMCDAARKALAAKGIADERIYFDKFA